MHGDVIDILVNQGGINRQPSAAAGGVGRPETVA